MARIHYTPFQSVRALQGELNRFFEASASGCNAHRMATELPLKVDILENENQVILQADVPGLEQKDIRINVENGLLTISGERRQEEEQKSAGMHRQERAFGQFSRTFRLPNVTDLDNIRASCKNGELQVILPKREEAKAREIPVTVH
ncbi:MAG: Hsp20/alpha crystallin family protein [Magnetococcales bacterium]|nr:Hsp20/alpha crystallin family protein [Magnetococcales bacterium]